MYRALSGYRRALRALAGAEETFAGSLGRVLRRAVLVLAVLAFVFAPAQVGAADAVRSADVAAAMMAPTADVDSSVIAPAATDSVRKSAGARPLRVLLAVVLAIVVVAWRPRRALIAHSGYERSKAIVLAIPTLRGPPTSLA